MIHASVELIEAMRGNISMGRRDGAFETRACDGSKHNRAVAWGWGPHREPSQLHVDCPACLRLMRDAMDPVRWDFLESRGLAWKLEAE